MKLFPAKILTVALLFAGVVTPVVGQIARPEGYATFPDQLVVTPPVTSPNPSPSPTPVPVTPPIQLPVIRTQSLKSGRLNVSYSANVSAYDTDSANLRMVAFGLPNGLNLGDCEVTSHFGVTRIGCTISGTPTEIGTFDVEIKVSDGQGGITKNFPLTISTR